jgi:enoyl-CoA hydratase/carnithine racemase
MGIVQKVVPAAELMAAAKAWVKANPRLSSLGTRRSFRIPRRPVFG